MLFGMGSYEANSFYQQFAVLRCGGRLTAPLPARVPLALGPQFVMTRVVAMPNGGCHLVGYAADQTLYATAYLWWGPLKMGKKEATTL